MWRAKPSFLIGLAVLLALIAAVFWPVHAFAFVCWDDDSNFIQNPLLAAPWSWPLLGRLLAAEQALRFEPVYWFCCRLVYAAAGLEPSVWHLLGLSWHLLATALFAVGLRSLCLRLDPGAGLRAELSALGGAAIWALHPLRSETIAWATASTYPLTGVFLLASAVCYLRAYEPGRRHGVWLGLSWGLAMLGYGSYPVGVTYGMWLVTFDLWLFQQGLSREGPRQRCWWIKHAAFILPAVAAVGITVWTRYASPGIYTVAPDLHAVGVPLRVVMALAGLSALAGGFVWPVDLSPNRVPLDLSATGALPLVLVAAVLAAAALLAAGKVRSSHTGLALAVWGFAVLSIPCLGLTERPTWPVDRYSYLTHLVLIGGLAVFLLRWKKVPLVLIALIVLAVVGSEAVAARRQIMIWRDSETLFSHMEREPRFSGNPRQQGHVYILWGRYLAVNHSPARAAEMFNRANEIYLNAIKAAVARNDYSEALSLSTHIGHFFTFTPVMHRERGVWMLRLGQRAEALAELQLAQAALPDDARVKQFIIEAQK